jgi:hypothetical protein
MEELQNCLICDSVNSVITVKIGGVNTRICQSCGYQTNIGLVEGTDLEKSIYESQPELFKDLKLVDSEHYVWYPTVLNTPNVIMLFPDGKNIDDWGWRVAEYIPLAKSDKPFKNQTHKLDIVNSTVLPPLMFSAALYLYSTFLRDNNEI